MPASPHTLRAECEDLDRAPRHFNERQRVRHERIVGHATQLLANHGRHNILFRNLAAGLNISAYILRFHFADLDALLLEILRRHLLALCQAIGAVPHDAPNVQQKRRAAYLAHTRAPFGGLTAAHLLLVEARQTLPETPREIIEQTRRVIGETLAGDQAEEAFLLLDAANLHPDRIQAILATLLPAAAPEPAVQPRPAAKRVKTPLTFQKPEIRAGAEKPGDWIYALAVPQSARAPPVPA